MQNTVLIVGDSSDTFLPRLSRRPPGIAPQPADVFAVATRGRCNRAKCSVVQRLELASCDGRWVCCLVWLAWAHPVSRASILAVSSYSDSRLPAGHSLARWTIYYPSLADSVTSGLPGDAHGFRARRESPLLSRECLPCRF